MVASPVSQIEKPLLRPARVGGLQGLGLLQQILRPSGQTVERLGRPRRLQVGDPLVLYPVDGQRGRNVVQAVIPEPTECAQVQVVRRQIGLQRLQIICVRVARIVLAELIERPQQFLHLRVQTVERMQVYSVNLGRNLVQSVRLVVDPLDRRVVVHLLDQPGLRNRQRAVGQRHVLRIRKGFNADGLLLLGLLQQHLDLRGQFVERQRGPVVAGFLVLHISQRLLGDRGGVVQLLLGQPGRAGIPDLVPRRRHQTVVVPEISGVHVRIRQGRLAVGNQGAVHPQLLGLAAQLRLGLEVRGHVLAVLQQHPSLVGLRAQTD